jgi:endonuclease/exonuclease/phosphatase family metal-dependent hydrolase
MHGLRVFVGIGLLAFTASAVETISGRAVTPSFKPLADVIVSLLHQGVVDTTGADGRFALSFAPSATHSPTYSERLPAIVLHGNQIRLTLAMPQRVAVAVYGLSGQMVATVFEGTLGAGTYHYPLEQRNLNMASGLYVLRISTQAGVTDAKITVAGDRILSDSRLMPRVWAGSDAVASLDAQDTVVFSVEDYVTRKVPLQSLTTQSLGNVILTPLFWETKVMTFNIRGPADPSPNSWSERKPRVINAIKTYQPEIICFQEMIASYIPDILGGCPNYVSYGRGRDADGGGESCHIFYRQDLWQLDSSNSGTFWYGVTPDVPGSIGWGASLPRICTHARLVNKTTKQALYVFNSHYDYQYETVMYNSAVQMADSVAGRAHSEEPFVVTGDFNANESSPAIEYLKHGVDNQVIMEDSYRVLYPDDTTNVGTYHGYTGSSSLENKIDYILSAKDSFRVLSAEAVRYNEDGLYPSDHFPVFAYLKFPLKVVALLTNE